MISIPGKNAYGCAPRFVLSGKSKGENLRAVTGLTTAAL